PEFHEEWGELADEVGLWFDGWDPPVTPSSELAAHVRMTDWLLERKYRALRAQASQTLALEERVGRERYRQWWATESFVSADRVLAAGDVTRLPAGPAPTHEPARTAMCR